MKILFLSLTLILASCTKQAPSNLSDIVGGKSDTPIRVVEMNPLIVNVEPQAILVPEGDESILIETVHGKPGSKMIAVINKIADNTAITYSSSAMPGFRIDSNCVEETLLKKNRACFISIYFNENGSVLPGSPEVTGGQISVVSGENVLMLNFSGKVNGETLEEVSAETIEISKSAITFDTEHYVGLSHSDLIVVHNPSRVDLPTSLALGVNANGFVLDSSCGEVIKKFRSCAIVVSHDATGLEAGEYSHSIALAGKIIPVNAIVESFPSFEFNPNFAIEGLPSSNFIEMGAGGDNSFSLLFSNSNSGNPYSGSLMFSKDLDLNADSMPESISIRNTCSAQLLQNRQCVAQLAFDPSRFPLGVLIERTLYIGGEEYTLNLEGDSPCHPSHPQHRPDAQEGYKLSPDKKSCIPNVGVFDSPDSYFGHAVFE